MDLGIYSWLFVKHSVNEIDLMQEYARSLNKVLAIMRFGFHTRESIEIEVFALNRTVHFTNH